MSTFLLLEFEVENTSKGGLKVNHYKTKKLACNLLVENVKENNHKNKTPPYK